MFEKISDEGKYYRQMFEATRAVKLIINPADGSIVDANDAACHFYGYSKDKITSLTISDINILPPDKILVEMEKASSESKSYFNFRHRLSSGEIRDVEVYSGPVKYEGDTLLYSIIHDITEKKQAEQLLQEREYFLTSIFRASPTGIGVIIDRVIKEVNERFCDMVGYAREDMVGENSRIVYASNEEYERVGQEKYRQISKRGTGTVETKLLCKDGTMIDVLLSSTPLIAGNLSSGVTFTATDITGLKIAEGNLRDKVKELNDALAQIKTLKGVIPICMHCKGIRDDKGSWNQLEKYIIEHSDAQFSHGICDKCLKEHYPDYTK